MTDTRNRMSPAMTENFIIERCKIFQNPLPKDCDYVERVAGILYRDVNQLAKDIKHYLPNGGEKHRAMATLDALVTLLGLSLSRHASEVCQIDKTT